MKLLLRLQLFSYFPNLTFLIFLTFLVNITVGNEILQDPVLLQKPNSNIFVALEQSLDPIYERISAKSYPTREDKIYSMYLNLKKATSVWHRPILKSLEDFGFVGEEKVISFWITNQIFIRNATPTVIQYLMELNSVKSITEEKIIPLLSNPSLRFDPRPTQPIQWGPSRVGADKVWNVTKGGNVRVAIIDTGVRENHEALKPNYVGGENNGWFDPIQKTMKPSDSVGHGTHCAGIICGKFGISVAPEAKWMACRGCSSAGCPTEALISCGQWVTCPTNAQNKNPQGCRHAAQIASCSWGMGGGNTFYNDVIEGWNKANIIGVFAIGNSGPDCMTAGSPGDQKGVISVGSTNKDEFVSDYSSRGPKNEPDGDVVPLIVAPGERILSSYHRSNTDYGTLDGTSMAAPCVAGGLCLLRAVNRNLTLEQAMDYLFSTTFKDLKARGELCGGKSNYPNDIAGHGRLQIDKAFEKMRAGQ